MDTCFSFFVLFGSILFFNLEIKFFFGYANHRLISFAFELFVLELLMRVFKLLLKFLIFSYLSVSFYPQTEGFDMAVLNLSFPGEEPQRCH